MPWQRYELTLMYIKYKTLCSVRLETKSDLLAYQCVHHQQCCVTLGAPNLPLFTRSSHVKPPLPA